MQSRHFSLCCALLALAGGSACAVNRPAASGSGCTVQGAELLPPASGGADALCAEIDTATAGAAAPLTVVVRVVAPSTLAAQVTVGGDPLPELRMARSDRPLDRSAFRRFAQAIATAAAAK